jgi:hypothetical protein
MATSCLKYMGFGKNCQGRGKKIRFDNFHQTFYTLIRTQHYYARDDKEKIFVPYAWINLPIKNL